MAKIIETTAVEKPTVKKRAGKKVETASVDTPVIKTPEDIKREMLLWELDALNNEMKTACSYYQDILNCKIDNIKKQLKEL